MNNVKERDINFLPYADHLDFLVEKYGDRAYGWMKDAPPLVKPEYPGDGESYGYFTWRLNGHETTVRVSQSGYMTIEQDHDDFWFQMRALFGPGWRVGNRTHADDVRAESAYRMMQRIGHDLGPLHLVNCDGIRELAPGPGEIW